MPQVLNLCPFITLTMEVVEIFISRTTMADLQKCIEVHTTIPEDTLVVINKKLFTLIISRQRILSRDIIYKMALEGTVIFKSPMADSYLLLKAREKQHSTIS